MESPLTNIRLIGSSVRTAQGARGNGPHSGPYEEMYHKWRTPALPPERHPDGHLGAAAVAPGVVGDQAEVERPGLLAGELPVQRLRPGRPAPGLGLAFQHGDAAERPRLEAGLKRYRPGDRDVHHADPFGEVDRLHAVDDRPALDGDLVA